MMMRSEDYSKFDEMILSNGDKKYKLSFELKSRDEMVVRVREEGNEEENSHSLLLSKSSQHCRLA